MRLFAAAENAPRNKEQHVDETNAEQRHERQIKQRRMHEGTCDCPCHPHQHRAQQRENSPIQTFRAEAQRLIASATAQIKRAAQQPAEAPGKRQRADQHAHLPQHDRLAEVAGDVAKQAEDEVVLHGVRVPPARRA